MMGKGAVPANIWEEQGGALRDQWGSGILAVNLDLGTCLSALCRSAEEPESGLRPCRLASVISFLTYVKAIIKSRRPPLMSR